MQPFNVNSITASDPDCNLSSYYTVVLNASRSWSRFAANACQEQDV